MRTFYVNNTAAPGGDGSEERPFSDLPQWEAIQQDGDIVHVKNTGKRYEGVIVKVAPVQLLGETVNGENVALNPDSSGYNCIRVEFSEHWHKKKVGGIVIEGFDAYGGTQSGFWGSIADGIKIRKCRSFDALDWGFHFTGCDDLVIEDCVAIRPKRQHGIYVTGCSQRPKILRCMVFYPNNIGVHINNDKDDSEAMFKDHPEYITPRMKGVWVEKCLIVDAGYGGGGGGMDGDGVEDAVYVNNTIISKGWGVNLHDDDSKQGTLKTSLVNNTIIAKWPINVAATATECLLINNTLVIPGSGDGFIDSKSADLLDENNTKTNKIPFTQEQLNAIYAMYERPENADPTEPLPELPPFPPSEEIPEAEASITTDVYDLEAFGLLCREYNTRVHQGKPQAESYQSVPDGYWGSGNVPTPKGKFTLPDLGIAFAGAYSPDQDEEIGIYIEAQGDATGQFAGATIISGSADIPPLRGEIFRKLKKDQYYALLAGTNSNASGRSPSLRIRIRSRGDTQRKTLDSLACVPRKMSGVIPSDPTDPTNPNPPTGDNIKKMLESAEFQTVKNLLLEFLRAANGK